MGHSEASHAAKIKQINLSPKGVFYTLIVFLLLKSLTIYHEPFNKAQTFSSILKVLRPKCPSSAMLGTEGFSSLMQQVEKVHSSQMLLLIFPRPLTFKACC